MKYIEFLTPEGKRVLLATKSIIGIIEVDEESSFICTDNCQIPINKNYNDVEKDWLKG